MRIEATTRARAWVFAVSIALAVLTLFGVAMALGGPGTSRAVEPKAEVPEFVPPEFPREWRWERKTITFDHMFRQLG